MRRIAIPQDGVDCACLQMLVFTAGLWTDWLIVIVIFVWIAIRVVEPFSLKGGQLLRDDAIGVGILTFVVNLALIFAWRILAGLEQAGDRGVWVSCSGRLQDVLSGRIDERRAVSSQACFCEQIQPPVVFFHFVVKARGNDSGVLALRLCRWSPVEICGSRRMSGLFHRSRCCRRCRRWHICMLPQHSYFHDFSDLEICLSDLGYGVGIAPVAVAVLVATVGFAIFSFRRARDAIFCGDCGRCRDFGNLVFDDRYDTRNSSFRRSVAKSVHWGLSSAGIPNTPTWSSRRSSRSRRCRMKRDFPKAGVSLCGCRQGPSRTSRGMYAFHSISLWSRTRTIN